MREKKGVIMFCIIAVTAVLSSVPALALEATQLVPVGSTVGIKMEIGGVIVAGLNQVQTEDGEVCPALNAGLRCGDVIKKIDDRATPDAAAFLTAVSNLSENEVELTVLRDSEEMTLHLTPARNESGAFQMGLWLRDGVSGIGTVTFYDPESGVYGALGHGICDLDTGKLLPFQCGELTASNVAGVVRGSTGTPGELCGEFDANAVCGTIEKNTDSGIFGSGGFDSYGAPVPVAKKEETKLGPAIILANVDGDDVKPYDVVISRIYRDSEDNRFLLLQVTDSDLLERTGGIVQGMSGSPILQDGKLVGAVTHVLINDPTRGYGISIENMLEAA